MRPKSLQKAAKMCLEAFKKSFEGISMAFTRLLQRCSKVVQNVLKTAIGFCFNVFKRPLKDV